VSHLGGTPVFSDTTICGDDKRRTARSGGLTVPSVRGTGALATGGDRLPQPAAACDEGRLPLRVRLDGQAPWDGGLEEFGKGAVCLGCGKVAAIVVIAFVSR
jgi:hypothetical protein